MRKFLKYLTVVAGMFTMIACSESEYEIPNLIPDEYNKILYFLDSGEQSVTLSNEESNKSFRTSIVKAGADPTALADVKLEVMTQEQVDEKWSKLTGRPHYLLTPDCYNISETSLSYAANDMYKAFTVTFNTSAVIDFIAEKKASYPDDVEYMKYVLPIKAIGVNEDDSINSQKNYVLYSIDNIAFSAPDQLYLIGEGVLENGNSIQLIKSNNIFSGTLKLGSDDIYVCDGPDVNTAANFYTITSKGKLELGKSVYNSSVKGICKMDFNFDKSAVITTGFGEIDYFVPFQCTYNREYKDFKIKYVGGGVFSGEGLSEWKSENWSWDNYADTRYKIRAHMLNGTVEEWARHDSANEVPSDNDVYNWSLETTHFWIANKGTGQGQWANGQWKYHYSWHHDGTTGFTQDNNIQKPIRFSIYFNGSTPTHRIETIE